MNRILRAATVCLALGAAACEGSPSEIQPDPDPGNKQPTCAITPAQVNTGGNLPALGLGCVQDRFTSELWVHNGWAYTGTWSRRGATGLGNRLYVWDVTGNTPVLRDSVVVSDAGTLGDVQVTEDGRYLVVATEQGQGSIVIYDLANPAKPAEIARLVTANTRNGVHTAEVARVNGRLYAFLSATTSSPARVVTVDLSDPRNPREVWVQPTGDPFTHDVFVRDGILFTAGWNAGTTVWDIGGGGRGGTPAAPVQLANIRTANGKVHNVWWYHAPGGAKRYLFIGEEGPGQTGVSSSGDIHVVDVGNGDWAGAREVAFFTVPGAGTHNFWVDEDSGIFYAAYYNGGVRALDVRGDLGSCTEAQKTDLRDARTGTTLRLCDLGKMGREVGRALVGGGQVSLWGVQVVGNRLYASDMLNGLWKIDVSSLKR
ncbi:MAG TPA: hypothetical protein VGR37_22950 [Longimicrobiaceae bacterium]|nr:hypothetical protein [Longimicrobiaceae bacterium]